jgi:hypothetical protein
MAMLIRKELGRKNRNPLNAHFCVAHPLASVTHKHAVETNIIGVASLNPGIFQASIFVHLAANGAGWRLALRRLLSSGTELEVKFFKGLSAGIRTKWPNIGDFDDPAFLATVGV